MSQNSNEDNATVVNTADVDLQQVETNNSNDK